MLDEASSYTQVLNDLELRHRDGGEVYRELQRVGSSDLLDELNDVLIDVAARGGGAGAGHQGRLSQINGILLELLSFETRVANRREEPAASGGGEAPAAPAVQGMPSYFGPASRQLMSDIEDQSESWGWVSRALVISAVLTVAQSGVSGGARGESAGRQAIATGLGAAGTATSGSEGLRDVGGGGALDVSSQAEALRAVPAIARHTMRNMVIPFVADPRTHGLNRQEVAFWTRFAEQL